VSRLSSRERHDRKESEVAGFLTKNEHPIERIARVGLGLGLLWGAATGALGAWGYVGVVPLLTGAIGSCPLYSLLGISTCPVPKGRAAH
jgi:hypothetical protein